MFLRLSSKWILNKIVDQKAKYSITKKKNFNIFKKDNKWVQIRYLLKNLEYLHQENAVFIENAIKGQLEAFLNTKTDEFKAKGEEYEDLKKQKYMKLDQIEDFKAKHKESKAKLDEVLLKYEKAKSKGNKSYTKLLELEMRAKLAQKVVHDETANIMETKESIKELRDEMDVLKKAILSNLSATYKEKLETFTSTIYSVINAYSDCFTEAVNIIDNVLIRDREESQFYTPERTSIMKRGLTNVKNLFEIASPMRQKASYEDLVNEDVKLTKQLMQYNSTAFMKLLKVRYDLIITLDNHWRM